MIEEERVALTVDELAEFVRKLDTWAESLPPRERAFLEQMLADAADAANQEASGYVNLSSLVIDDVGGYTNVATGGAVVGAVIGYARGLANDEIETAGWPFDDTSDSTTP
jgi:hypothetical protein